MSYLLKALIAKLTDLESLIAGWKATAKAKYGEHSGLVQAIELEIEKIANAEEKIETIQKHFSK